MYSWIEPSEIPHFIDKERVVLFGAGQGSVEFLQYLEESATRPQVIAVTDNDSSMWGKRFEGIEIISPKTVLNTSFHRIVITTVSGREAVSDQLRSMGLSEGTHFCKIGRYPAAFLHHLKTATDTDDRLRILGKNSRILHVGSGGFLGLECALYALGHRPVSVDAYDFSIQYPVVTGRKKEYEDAFDRVIKFASKLNYDTDSVKARWSDLFKEEQGRLSLDPTRIPFFYPHRFSALPFEDESFDAVLSFAVLEHVRNPRAAIRENYRVLAKGGCSIHKITTRDHRSFGKVSGYHPLSYLEHSEDEWERINENKFYQNRVLPFMWKELFEEFGFSILSAGVLDRYTLAEENKKALHCDFQHLPLERLEEINCLLVVKKP